MSKKMDVVLTWLEWEKIIENKDLFVKYLNKCKVNYQSWLWLWLYNGKEGDAYKGIATIDFIIEWLNSMEKKYKEYNDKKYREEAKKKQELEQSKKRAKDALKD